MLTCRVYQGGKLREEDFDPTKASDYLQEPGSRVWFDLVDPTEDELATIEEEFSLHPLAMEDVRKRDQRSKVEFFEGYLFLVLRGMSFDQDGEIVSTEVHAFAGHRFLITIRYTPVFDLSPALERWDRHKDMTKEGGGFLLYAMLDEVVDGYFQMIDQFEDRAEAIEDRVFADEPDRTVQQDIFRLKRQVVMFRRFVSPLREVVNQLQERHDIVTPALEPYYRDVSDHIIRSLDFADSVRDVLTSALEAQLSQVSNRLNQIMKRLTGWAGIILVPTLIAGIYGMNFVHMPELKWHLGYAWALGLMALSMAVLYWQFKKRDWL